jgi:hypothetical protein
LKTPERRYDSCFYLYLNEVDRMLEKAVDTTRRGKSTNVQYARFADDMVILIDAEQRSDWLVKEHRASPRPDRLKSKNQGGTSIVLYGLRLPGVLYVTQPMPCETLLDQAKNGATN